MAVVHFRISEGIVQARMNWEDEKCSWCESLTCKFDRDEAQLESSEHPRRSAPLFFVPRQLGLSYSQLSCRGWLGIHDPNACPFIGSSRKVQSECAGAPTRGRLGGTGDQQSLFCDVTHKGRFCSNLSQLNFFNSPAYSCSVHKAAKKYTTGFHFWDSNKHDWRHSLLLHGCENLEALQVSSLNWKASSHEVEFKNGIDQTLMLLSSYNAARSGPHVPEGGISDCSLL